MPKLNSIEHLWTKEAEELTNEDIDEIIAHQLKLLTAYESGVKPKRDAEEAIDWTAVVAKIAKTTVTAVAPKKKLLRRI